MGLVRPRGRERPNAVDGLRAKGGAPGEERDPRREPGGSRGSPREGWTEVCQSDTSHRQSAGIAVVLSSGDSLGDEGLWEDRGGLGGPETGRRGEREAAAPSRH